MSNLAGVVCKLTGPKSGLKSKYSVRTTLLTADSRRLTQSGNKSDRLFLLSIISCLSHVAVSNYTEMFNHSPCWDGGLSCTAIYLRTICGQFSIVHASGYHRTAMHARSAAALCMQIPRTTYSSACQVTLSRFAFLSGRNLRVHYKAYVKDPSSFPSRWSLPAQEH